MLVMTEASTDETFDEASIEVFMLTSPLLAHAFGSTKRGNGQRR
jgi:hypothetical protein